MKFLVSVLILLLVTIVKCDYSLNLRMEYFKNELALPNEKFKFKYCMFNGENGQCESTLVTQIIGENVITEDQFRQTTQFLSFKIPNSQIQSRNYLFNLSIFIMGSNERVVSSWNLYVTKESPLLRLDEWIKYNQINADQSQQLTFSYNLKCFDGFKGPQCSIDMCDLNCKNNGKCVRENGKQFCRCDSNLFKGDLCEIRIVHTCEMCLNGGSCFGNNECLCPPGYGGKRCEIKQTESECGVFSCFNSGRCFIDNQNEYSCVCPSGFSGKRCENRISSSTKMNTQTTYTTKIFTIQSTNSDNLVFAVNSDSFSTHQIVIILITGVGIPILFILVAIIFYKTVIVEKKSESSDLECGKNQGFKQEEVKEKKENIYVICQSNSVTKSESVSKNSTKSSSESEIYSTCIYDDLNQFGKVEHQKIQNLTEEKNYYSNNLATYV